MYTVIFYRRGGTKPEIKSIKEVVTWKGVLHTHTAAVNDLALAIFRIERVTQAGVSSAPKLVRFERLKRLRCTESSHEFDRDQGKNEWLTLDELKHALFYGKIE